MIFRDRIRELRRVKASSLKPNPRNWRTHPPEQLAAMRAVLAEVGFAGAILCRELPSGVLEVIDGHARASISDEAIVPVLILDVDEKEADKLLATFDPLGAMAGKDLEKYIALVAGVEFENAEVQKLIDSLAEQDQEGDPAAGGGDGFDATPKDGETRSAVGDLWLIGGGKHRLAVGDCTAQDVISRLFAGEVPSIMVTDPPYGVKYDPTWRHKAGINKSGRTGKVSNDDQADWTPAWRLFPGNVVYVWHGALHGSTVHNSLVAAGFQVRAQLIWVKPRLRTSRGHYHWKHEPALVATKPSPEEPQPEPDQGPECEVGYYASRKGASAQWAGGRKQTTAWEIGFAGEEKTHHGTQKPVECMAKPIRNHGKPGDIVYDPFLGSGTTLIASIREGRRCFGCELDPQYADVILRRAEAEGLLCEKSKS